MNLNLIIGAIVALAVLGGGAWYVSTHPMTPSTGSEQTQSAPTGDSGTTTFAALAELPGARSCDVTVNTAVAEATGVIYVADGKIRADITAKPAGLATTITAHIIRADGYVYNWTDMVPQGVRVSVAASGEVAASQGFDLNTNVAYDCTPWSVDESKFVVPANITFREFSGQGNAP